MDSEIKREYVELIVGVSGHRWVTETPRIVDALDAVFEKIIQSFFFEELVLVSPLAEGADRIVAKRALTMPNTRLRALLPFPMEEYLKDFPSNESEWEFRELYDQADQVNEMPGNPVREEAYLELGRALIDQSDVLIAIWDGKPAKGKGGTEEVVQMARKHELPLAWIVYEQAPLNENDVNLREAIQGRVTFERFPG